jgi:hypothetical protein
MLQVVRLARELSPPLLFLENVAALQERVENVAVGAGPGRHTV